MLKHKQPVVKQLVAKQPAAKQPEIKQPLVKQPAAKQPAVKQPMQPVKQQPKPTVIENNFKNPNNFTEVATVLDEKFYNAGFRSLIQTPFGMARIPYSDIKKSIQSLIASDLLKKDFIHFDDEQKTIYAKYSFHEMAAILAAVKNAMINTKNADIMAGIWSLFPLLRDKKTHELLHNAKKLFDKVPAKFNEFPLTNLPKDTTSKEAQEKVLEQFYSGRNGIPIGEETHYEQTPKQFLMNHAKKLKSLGVNYIFLEHFTEEMQPNLDQFFQTGIIPKDLDCYLESLDRGFSLQNAQYNFRSLLVSMQRNGIKPIAIETSYSYGIKTGLEGNDKDRMLAMNYMFKQKLDELLKKDPNARWTALVGAAHVTTHHQVPGLSELLKCPVIVVGGSAADQALHLNYQDLKDPDNTVKAQAWFKLSVDKNRFSESVEVKPRPSVQPKLSVQPRPSVQPQPKALIPAFQGNAQPVNVVNRANFAMRNPKKIDVALALQNEKMLKPMLKMRNF